MTVAELIEELKAMPPEAKVLRESSLNQDVFVDVEFVNLHVAFSTRYAGEYKVPMANYEVATESEAELADYERIRPNRKRLPGKVVVL